MTFDHVNIKVQSLLGAPMVDCVNAIRRDRFIPYALAERGYFVWLAVDDLERWNTYRVPEREEDVRFIEELAPEEIFAASQSIRRADAVVEIARAFGIRRLSS